MSSEQAYPDEPIVDQIARFSVDELNAELVRLRNEAAAIERRREVLVLLLRMRQAES